MQLSGFLFAGTGAAHNAMQRKYGRKNEFQPVSDAFFYIFFKIGTGFQFREGSGWNPSEIRWRSKIG